MIDNPDSFFTPANQPVPPPGSNHPAPLPYPNPGGPQKSNRRLILIILGIAGTAVACLCVCLAVGAWLFIQGINEQTRMEQVIDQYMTAMNQNDPETAYSFLSARARETISVAALKREIEAEASIKYRGYQSVSVYSSSQRSEPSGDPASTLNRSDIEGTITYEGGDEIDFYATLDQESGEWKLFDIWNMRQPVRNKQG